jgi:Adenylate and Guanylate cyclase catalytic domain
MDYEVVLAQVLTLLQQEKRLSYRVLKLRLQLNDDTLEALKEDLIYAKQLAVDEDGRVLVWTGAAGAVTAPGSGATEPVKPPDMTASQDLHVGSSSPAPRTPDAERRQLTVLFCDLVDSTRLASQLDPEELREVVRAYQETCAKVIARYERYIAQYLGDGLLVYFGYPRAHEDYAPRTVRAGLGLVEVIGTLNTQLQQDRELRLAVRVGIHTGLVVVGEMGGSRQEQLALGGRIQCRGSYPGARRAGVGLSDLRGQLGTKSPGGVGTNRLDATGWPRVGRGTAPGAVGAGQRGPRAGGAAQR